MEYTAMVVTLSDKGAQDLRRDKGWVVTRTAVPPDERPRSEAELLRCADEERVRLMVTTGFFPGDVTPEATRAVVRREVPGIPDVIRAESLRITPRSCLSREAAGSRGETLIVNCPGSEKAARECLGAVLPALRHGIDILRSRDNDCGDGAHRHGL